MIIDGQEVNYRDWMLSNPDFISKGDEAFMDDVLGITAPKEGEPTTGYRIFYRTPKGVDRGDIHPDTLYGVMQPPLLMDTVTAAPGLASGINTSFIDVNTLDEDELFDLELNYSLDPRANGTESFPIGQPTNKEKNYFYFPTKDLAERYLQNIVRNQQGLEQEENGSNMLYQGVSDEEWGQGKRYLRYDKDMGYGALPIGIGQYEIHRVEGIAGPATKDAGFLIKDMIISPEVEIIIKRDEPSKNPVYPDNRGKSYIRPISYCK